MTCKDQKRFNQDHFLQDLGGRLQGELYRNCEEPYKNFLEFLMIYLIITPH